jgi:hypothetical protein
MRNLLNIIVIFCLLFSINIHVRAETEQKETAGCQLTGQASGPTQGIAVQGDYAYI